MKFIKYFFLFIGLIVLIAVVLFLKAWYAKDLPSFSEPKLELPKVSIAQSDNAYYDLAKLPKELTLNSPELIYFDQAATKNGFFDPDVLKPENLVYTTTSNVTVGPYLTGVRNAAKIKQALAENLISQNKNEETFLEAEKIVKVGHFLSSSQSPTIYYLVGIAVSNMGWNTLDKIPVNTLSKEFRNKHYLSLSQLKNTREGLKNAIKLEYLTSTNSLEKLMLDLQKENNTADKPPQFYLPNKTKKLMADNYLRWINELNNNCPITLEPTHYMKNPVALTAFFTENATGKILTDMMTSALGTISTKMCENEALADKVLNKLK